ncbi:MAG: hydrogenase maturation protease [Deltaproteobacteria bacterium]|nr:hydrogenase maturation protease [Deltaproteobacteria bacterium]
MRALVIGIGSPFGDDAVGLHVAERLSGQSLPDGVAVVARDRPGLSLLDDLESTPAAVIVDALRSGAQAGSVLRIPPAALARDRLTSSHTLRVAETLSLAVALGRRLPALRVVAIEIVLTQGETLSPEVAAAIEPACEAALAALGELLPRA